MAENKEILYLVVHCSDTGDKNDLSAIDIHKLHLQFGWDGIGYHKIIKRNGVIQAGRPEYWMGAHVKGYNKNSLGVCLIGSKNFTNEQFLSLEKILRDWKSKYPSSIILGHCDFSYTQKTCPNFNVIEWCQTMNIE